MPRQIRLLRIFVLLYILVGLMFVLVRRKSSMLVKWPKILLSAIPFLSK